MGKYASKVVEQAAKWIGLNEYDGTHKKVIDIYNAQKPLPVGYKVKYTDEWCATFVSAVAVELGYTDIIPTECSCPRMINLHKKLGIFIENENRVPNPGDILFYDWQDNGIGDNKGEADHVGIVEKVSGDVITIIEGNYSNSVKRRNLAVNGKYMRGYSAPKYDVEKSTAQAQTSTVSNTENKIDTVKEVQNWANTNYKAGLVVDGIYGKNTKKALVKILQTEINKAYNTKLVVDGIWGEKTKAACPTLRNGSKNNIVGVLKALLICNGYKDAYLTNNYGEITVATVKTYQKKKGLVVDGIAGKNTFDALCK